MFLFIVVYVVYLRAWILRSVSIVFPSSSLFYKYSFFVFPFSLPMFVGIWRVLVVEYSAQLVIYIEKKIIDCIKWPYWFIYLNILDLGISFWELLFKLQFLLLKSFHVLDEKYSRVFWVRYFLFYSFYFLSCQFHGWFVSLNRQLLWLVFQ